MRRDDVSGGKCRSDAVWMVLAKDFVQTQLESKAVTGWDVVSIILMRDEAELVIEHEPLDWILYNKLIDMREWSSSRPSCPGNYLPALAKAEYLLASNNSGSCALSLVFFSDGKPSDHGPFVAKMGDIASQYRRRLTFSCIGIAQADENEAFETLHDMVSEAEAFGAKSSFTAPSLDASSLSSIISAVSSSVTSTKTEMTDLATGETRAVRQDVRSERQGIADDLRPTEEWNLYGLTSTKSVGRIWNWASEKDDFVILRDPRCIFCKKEPTNSPLQWCTICQVAAFCVRCEDMMAHHLESAACRRLKKDHQCGRIVTMELPSFSVAVKEPIFGEGAERIVRKFRFIDKESNFIGPKMVAKESRFIDPSPSYDKERAFHANFMRTQKRAAEVASHFNEAMNDLHNHFAEKHKAWIDKLPRIEFVDPMLVEVLDGYEKKHILIEQFLEGEYEKFNNNMGFVKGKMQREDSNDDEELIQGIGGVDLAAIMEESEDEDEDDSDDELYDPRASELDRGHCSDIEDHLFAQAFSHYSFEKSKRCFMVVDLQGVFARKPDGTRKFMLTDPAIHKKNSKGREAKRDFGRTDRGRKGMKAFFRSHVCSDACRLLGLQMVDPQTLQFLSPEGVTAGGC